MTASIHISRRTLLVGLLASLLLFGAAGVLANHTDDIVHVCIHDNGMIKQVNQASDCKADETANALVTEQAYLALLARVNELETALVVADEALAAAQSAQTTAANAQTTADNAQATASAAQTAAANAQTTADDAQVTANAAQTAAANAQGDADALNDLLQHVSRDGNDITITGANLHIVNGEGTTQSTNSLGNLIIGYNESRFNGGADVRSGSHMLVIGTQHNYSSYGGMVVGVFNTASGAGSSVSGGTFNTASGAGSSVSGGLGNTAIGLQSSVSGGYTNTASGSYASVSGGTDNFASGVYASVSGGTHNFANGDYASVVGGVANFASGYLASVSGGSNNIASGPYSSVSGGYNRQVSGSHDWAAGTLFEEQ